MGLIEAVGKQIARPRRKSEVRALPARMPPAAAASSFGDPRYKLLANCSAFDVANSQNFCLVAPDGGKLNQLLPVREINVQCVRAAVVRWFGRW